VVSLAQRVASRNRSAVPSPVRCAAERSGKRMKALRLDDGTLYLSDAELSEPVFRTRRGDRPHAPMG
jgi:hypothetical protein